MTTRHLVDPELVPMLDQFPVWQFTREALRRALRPVPAAAEASHAEAEAAAPNL